MQEVSGSIPLTSTTKFDWLRQAVDQAVKILSLTRSGAPDSGGIAQLGERLHGMQEVSGSIPLTSTT